MLGKVMICYSDAGNGPLRASEALKEALQSVSDPNLEVVIIDVLKETSKLGFLAVRLYNYLLGKSLTWNTLGLRAFYESDLIKSGALLQYAVPTMKKLLENERPDVLVFTNPWVIAYVIRAIGELDGQKPKTISMVVDLGCGDLPPSWFHSGIDSFIVPTNEARAELLTLGAVESKIKVFGMPIALSYIDSKRIAENLPDANHQRAQGTKIVVMGGRSGTKNTFEIVKCLINSGLSLQLTVLCGNNNGLKKKIESYISRFELLATNNHVKVLGFEPDSFPVMRTADIIVTKPGALTVSESAALGIPVILDTYPAVMGQEVGNVKYVEMRSIGLIARTPDEVPQLVSTLINNPAEFRHSGKKCQEIAGTIEIAKFVSIVLKLSNDPMEYHQETKAS